MISINSCVAYKPCIKCSRGLAKADNTLCKDCKPKKESIRTLSKSQSKVHLHKFELNFPSSGKEHVKNEYVPETAFFRLRYRLKKEASLLTNTKAPAHFFTLYWDQFNNFDDFSSFIANSGQVSSLYFMYNCVTIQKSPKYQKFITTKKDEFPAIVSSIQRISPPISRPILLLEQKSYWDGLITSYFKHVHSLLPAFSIHSFNSETISKPLLSAIYFGGFMFMQDNPLELVNYFNDYAEKNIKEANRLISLQNAQAVFLYSFIMLLSGNFKLFRACQAQAIRMCYALGLHLNLKKITPIQRYDRSQFFSNLCSIHIIFYGVINLSLNQLTELGDCDTRLRFLKPEYQIPNSKCYFSFDTKDENIVYGICIHTHFVLSNMQAQHIFNLSRCTNNLIQVEFNTLLNKAREKYLKCMSIYDLLLKEYPHLKQSIQSYRINLIQVYHMDNLEMYTLLRYKVNNLTPRQISKMLNECVDFFNTIIESQGIIQIIPTYPYMTGLNFLNIYKIANLHEKSIIKQKLEQLLEYLSRGPYIDKLPYLIIKNQYESILRS